MSRIMETLEISKLIKWYHPTVQKFVNAGKTERKKLPKNFSKRDVSELKREMARNPHLFSQQISIAAGFPNTPKTTRCRILQSLGNIKTKKLMPWSDKKKT